jgi:arylsulfatase A-like enzyme
MRYLLLLLLTSTSLAQTQLNILFIAVDDLKPVMGCYGDKIARTPNIDRLAARGTVFTKAYCQWPVCGPSRASLMTSLRPEANGVMDLKTDVRAKNPAVITLPQHFIQQGYTTAGCGKIYDPRCVDSKKDCDKPSWSLPFITPKAKNADAEHEENAPAYAIAEGGDDDQTDGQIARTGIGLMETLAAEKKPFFLAVGFKKPHLPFVAPKAYFDLYQPEKLPLATHSGGIENDSGYVLHDSAELRGYGGIPKTDPIPRQIQREALHAYLACVSFVDAQVGRLIKQLDDLGLTQNTIVVLVGDHGFHLGDHGMWGKHSVLEHAARVPLIVVPPAGSVMKENASPVEFTDIFPTLCTLSRVPLPAGIAGRSLQPLIEGREKAVREGALTVFQNKGTIGYSYRTGRHRYTEWVNKYGKTVAADLFDYKNDALETKNLIADPTQSTLCKKLAALLRADATGCERLFMKE